MQTAPNIVHGDWKTYQHEAERVRAMVFIAEQKVPRELEFDEDDKTAEHFISFDARHMVTGCARLLDNGRIGRVAVLRPFRGRDEDCPRAREGARHEGRAPRRTGAGHAVL